MMTLWTETHKVAMELFSSIQVHNKAVRSCLPVGGTFAHVLIPSELTLLTYSMHFQVPYLPKYKKIFFCT